MNAKKPLVAVVLSGALVLPAAADAAFVDLRDARGVEGRDPGDLRSDLSPRRPDSVRSGRSDKSKPGTLTSSSRAGKSGRSSSPVDRPGKSAGTSKNPRRGRPGTGPDPDDDLPVGDDLPPGDSPPVGDNPPDNPVPDTSAGPGGGSDGGGSNGPPPVADAGPGGNGQPDDPTRGDPGEAPDEPGLGDDDEPGLGDSDEPGSIGDELPNTGIGNVDLGPEGPDGDDLNDLLVDIPGGALGSPAPSDSPPGEDQSAGGPSPGSVGPFGAIPNGHATAAVPEPSSLALVALGLAGLGAARRKPPAA